MTCTRGSFGLLEHSRRHLSRARASMLHRVRWSKVWLRCPLRCPSRVSCRCKVTPPTCLPMFASVRNIEPMTSPVRFSFWNFLSLTSICNGGVIQEQLSSCSPPDPFFVDPPSLSVTTHTESILAIRAFFFTSSSRLWHKCCNNEKRQPASRMGQAPLRVILASSYLRPNVRRFVLSRCDF